MKISKLIDEFQKREIEKGLVEFVIQTNHELCKKEAVDLLFIGNGGCRDVTSG